MLTPALTPTEFIACRDALACAINWIDGLDTPKKDLEWLEERLTRATTLADHLAARQLDDGSDSAQHATLLRALARRAVGDSAWDLLGEKLQRALLCQALVNQVMSLRVAPGSTMEQFQLLALKTLSTTTDDAGSDVADASADNTYGNTENSQKVVPEG